MLIWFPSTASRSTTWKNSPRSAKIGPTFDSKRRLRSSGDCKLSPAAQRNPVINPKEGVHVFVGMPHGQMIMPCFFKKNCNLQGHTSFGPMWHSSPLLRYYLLATTTWQMDKCCRPTWEKYSFEHFFETEECMPSHVPLVLKALLRMLNLKN